MRPRPFPTWGFFHGWAGRPIFMKILFPLILISLFGLSSLRIIAQPICGFDRVHAKRMREDESYRKNVLTTENSIRTWIREHPQMKSGPGASAKISTGATPATLSAGATPTTLSTGYTIPVVVHVINTGGDVGTIYNPTDAQILRAIAYLNAVYNGSYPGTQGAGNLGIQFVLAQRDPNCNPSNGINRVDGSGVSGYLSGGINVNNTTGASELSVKSLSRWDNTQYYNIWIVNKIDGNDGTSGQFIAGYAYFPGAPATLDGIVMLATQMETGQKTLPHEIGHAFNLYHPFEGSTDASQCPAATYNDCSLDGDQVCDTPPISENINSATGVIDFACRSELGSPNNINACTGSLYTKATEHNYMNYTYCYDQFTLGQAARMQAAAVGPYRASLTTSLGGVAPSSGGCSIPKIDFQLAGDRVAELTTASSGCRSYTDYSFNMEIGVAPTATATATLSLLSGTAVQGLDFDISTNGSFTSPSSVLTFPAGATNSQPFTIRVYDDASVNGTRTATLGFTVNNGGGNAVAGDLRTNFTMTIDDNDVAPTTGTSPYGTASLGTAQGTYPGIPLDPSQTSMRTQVLYRASELTAGGASAGKLSGLSFYVASKSSIRPYTNLYIKLGTTTASWLVNGTAITVGSSMTTVKSLASFTPAVGWNTISFDVPFTWNGTRNVIVEFCYDNGSSDTETADALEMYVDGGTNQGNMIWQSGVNCWENFSGLNYATFKPLFKFSYGITPTIVQTALNSSQSQYLGPNADIYFYDQANGQLMARIQNLSSFDYGCTQVIIDRAGTSTSQFWNTNPINYLMNKTFHVIPTTNNSSGSYNVTLYYTQAEVQGWQTATGQTLSAIQLVKVPGQISSVTPANPFAAGTPTIVTPTTSTLGTNTGLTYNFTNGFSGFGAGVPSLIVLPIHLLQFTGRLDNNNALLSWSTSLEENSAGFEVERSNDGQHFSKIGYVPAAGNSTTERDYGFNDPSLVADSNYYQLKLISLDGRVSYSKVVLVRDPHATPGFTALPNPFSTDLELLFGHLPNEPIQIRLLDITGRPLWRQTAVQSDGARLHLGISGASLSAGVYFLEVRSSTGVETQRVIKR